MENPTNPGFVMALRRGARKRCPRCGEGALFRGWFELRERCSVCALVFEPTPGDTWGFWVFMDRLFLFAAIVLLFFGFRPQGWPGRIVFLAAVAVPLVATMPHRLGIATAVDWFWRSRSETGSGPIDRRP